MAIINQAGTACIASDSARAAISEVLKQTSAWLVPPKFWLDANKHATDLAHGFGQLRDKSNYNRDAHEQAVYEIILAGERMAVGIAGEKARTVFWQEFEQRNTTRGGKIWEGKTSHTLSE
jgi:hypothetical protein